MRIIILLLLFFLVSKEVVNKHVCIYAYVGLGCIFPSFHPRQNLLGIRKYPFSSHGTLAQTSLRVGREKRRQLARTPYRRRLRVCFLYMQYLSLACPCSNQHLKPKHSLVARPISNLFSLFSRSALMRYR